MDGWIVDSGGAVYDVRVNGRSTRRVMNVDKLITQLLFVERQPHVFYYARSVIGYKRTRGNPRLGKHARGAEPELLNPLIVLARGEDALRVLNLAYDSAGRYVEGPELPKYATERKSDPRMWVVGTKFDTTYHARSDVALGKYGIVYDTDISGHLDAELMNVTGNKTERGARLSFLEEVWAPVDNEIVTLFAIGKEWGDITLEAVALRSDSIYRSVTIPHLLYCEWERRRRGF